MYSTVYNDWICKRVHGNTLDGYTEIAIKDMQGNWKVMRRFEEAGEFVATELHDYITSWLYKGQPVRHDSTTV